MANTILNLDDILPEDSFVVFRGEKHKVHPLSARHYLTMARDRGKPGNANFSEEYINTKQALDMIHMAIPTIDREDLEGLPIPAVMALSKAVEDATQVKGEGEGDDSGN